MKSVQFVYVFVCVSVSSLKFESLNVGVPNLVWFIYLFINPYHIYLIIYIFIYLYTSLNISWFATL